MHRSNRGLQMLAITLSALPAVARDMPGARFREFLFESQQAVFGTYPQPHKGLRNGSRHRRAQFAYPL